MKNFLKIFVWILTVGAIATGWAFTRKEHVEHPLKGIQLTLERDTKNGFIDYDAVYQTIAKICDTINNTDVMMIPLDSVRGYLKTIPWAIHSEANISLDEALVAELVECQPVMRVYNKRGKSVYLDADGGVYPIHKSYVPHVLIGNGDADFPVVTKSSSSIFDEDYKNTDLPKMFNVMKSVLSNSYTNCCVKQVYLAKNNSFELTMNNVDLKVILGDDDNIDVKLYNLQCFFEQMQGNPEMKNYSKVNFNFENQVVCTKNKVK